MNHFINDLFDENSIIYVDKNQRRGRHDNIDSFFQENNIKTVRKTLPIGDYLLDLGDTNVYIDTKRDWNEVGRNLLNKDDKERFLKEVTRASNEGKPLIILVEEDVKLSEWKNRRAKNYFTYDGKAIQKKINEFNITYPHVHFIQCPKKDTALNIIGFLTGILEYDERKIEKIKREQDDFYQWLCKEYPNGLPKDIDRL